MAARKPAQKAAPGKTPAKAEAVKAAPVKAAKKAAADVADAMSVEASALQRNVRNVAEKGIEQGRAAFDRADAAAREATEAFEKTIVLTSRGATGLMNKALDNARLNASAAFDHFKKLVGADDMPTMVSLHADFLRKQAEVALDQAKEFAELARKAATDSTAPLKAQIEKQMPKE
ncbi:MAG: TIGR01841 family phasin [Hyphomicrobiales bacterium]|nr:TIGR01841 family phasin [Hyphomicrobiales bacterium]